MCPNVDPVLGLDGVKSIGLWFCDRQKQTWNVYAHEFVSWDYDIPNTWKNKKHVPNQQPVIMMVNNFITNIGHIQPEILRILLARNTDVESAMIWSPAVAICLLVWDRLNLCSSWLHDLCCWLVSGWVIVHQLLILCSFWQVSMLVIKPPPVLFKLGLR